MRLTWAGALVIVGLTMGIVYQGSELMKARESLSSASALIELQARVNTVAFKTLDSCRALNEDLTFRGQAKLRAMFSDEAVLLRKGVRETKAKRRLLADARTADTDEP